MSRIINVGTKAGVGEGRKGRIGTYGFEHTENQFFVKTRKPSSDEYSRMFAAPRRVRIVTSKELNGTY